MSRQTLTPTEELEKLEQSITLTLQEIDHNFSKAHRIVTSSILPIVEQYAKHSRDVWEGSKFWKQFFESSANVSLTGYEEQPSTHDNLEDASDTQSTLETSEYGTPSMTEYSQNKDTDLDISSLTISPSQSTPRPKGKQPAYADYPSPYEELREQVGRQPDNSEPSTPTTSSAITNESHDITMTPSQLQGPSLIPRPSTARKKNDPLLHRVLDRNYRVQATPISTRNQGFANSRIAAAAEPATPATAARTHVRNRLLEANLSSSPDIPEPPQLRAEIFASPARKRPLPAMNKPRTPGVSVLTPAKPKLTPGDMEEDGWDSDGDDGGLPFGQSPPKTMQFHVPQSRLLKTPGLSLSSFIHLSSVYLY